MTIPPLVLEVPDLGDDRLRLRVWAKSDAPSLVRAWGDPAIIEGSSPPDDRSLDAAARWIGGCDERRRAGVAFDLAIADADDRVIGEVGLSRLGSERRGAMIGWWVHLEHRGQGVATTAVSMLTEWALGPGRLRALVAEIGAENDASIVVADRAGFRRMTAPADGSGNPQETTRGSAARVWYVASSTVK